MATCLSPASTLTPKIFATASHLSGPTATQAFTGALPSTIAAAQSEQPA